MILRRQLGSHFLFLSIALAAMPAACARKGPPAPVEVGQSNAVRPGTQIPAVRPPDVSPPVPAAVSGRTAVAPIPKPPHPDRPGKVTVRPGETLYAISRQHGVPVRSLIEANSLAPPYRLSAGRQLTIPQVELHIVQPGETLYSISRGYGVDTSTLAHSNGIEAPYVVRIGETLVLPAPVQLAAAGTAAVKHFPPPAEARKPPTVMEKSPPPAAAPDSRPPVQTAALPPASSAPTRNGTRTFLWPTHGRVISAYGTGEGGIHNDGINIAAPQGAPVVAADAGTVAYAGNELRGYGNLVLIKHPGGWITAYAHNATLLVKRGDRVKRGQTIARVGATGTVDQPQLHFEIRHGTRALDPSDYLPERPAVTASG